MERMKRTKVGTVVERKTDKTAVVKVERLMRHPAFKKYIKCAKIFKVHDAKNECQIGDQVLIAETKPVSKSKRWKLQKVLQHEEVVMG